ncbi:MAG: hypothetical protein ABL901_15185, partial [Hyphomicrobiaceae bacterium]
MSNDTRFQAECGLVECAALAITDPPVAAASCLGATAKPAAIAVVVTVIEVEGRAAPNVANSAMSAATVTTWTIDPTVGTDVAVTNDSAVLIDDIPTVAGRAGYVPAGAPVTADGFVATGTTAATNTRATSATADNCFAASATTAGHSFAASASTAASGSTAATASACTNG